MKEKTSRRYRSLFWPMLLIGVGTAWLLNNAGIFSAENIAVAFKLWPLIFIGIGLDMLFGRSSATRGATIGLAFVGFVLAIMYVGPSIGLGQTQERTQTKFDVPLDGAEQLELQIYAGFDKVVISPLVDSNDLLVADIWHLGELAVDVTDDVETKVISVSQKDTPFAFTMYDSQSGAKGWGFLINPKLPVSIDYEGGVGETFLDLRPFVINDLKLNMGIGSMNIQLPAPEQTYAVNINGGVGEVILTIPDDVAVRVDVSTGIGDVTLPPELIHIDGDGNFLGENGVWETEGFESAEQQILITFSGGVGSFEIR